jgi:hypothetical protein
MQNVTESCANCGEDTKSRRRDFSEQAWTVLLVWGEIQKATVDQAICDHCYGELRETLIDRADEIAAVASQPAATAAPRKAVSGKAGAAQTPAKAGQKVRKAG